MFSKISIVAISILVFAPFQAYADTATQTDWSGGDGVPGPVIDWGNSYDTSSRVDSTGGTLYLTKTPLATPIEHIVEENFGAPGSVYAADVDGDGDMDVLGSSNSNSRIHWWENTDGSGTVWFERTVDDNFENVNSVYAADVNGDGYMDVMGAAVGANDITWWENTDGSGTVWIEHTVDGDFDGAWSVYAADVDGDGYMDILGAAWLADDITWWENTDGSGTVWIAHTVDGDFDGVRSVYAADVDGDGCMDVLGAAPNTADITWGENTDGSGTVWIEHTVDGDFYGARSVHAADVDGDGDTDVLGAASQNDDITWWENLDGSGTVWIEHTVDGDFDGAWSVHTADVDGDGYMDVLGAAISDHIIAWWEVSGYESEGTLQSSILDAGTVGTWELFLSNSQNPAGTSVAFQFRSSADAGNMGAWSDTIFTACAVLSDILADSTQYLQYRVILETSDFLKTPVLDDLIFSYTVLVGVGEISSSEVTSWAFLPNENPSHGNLSILIIVPEQGMVELLLYDLSGRIIAGSSREFQSGTYSVYFNGLSEGVYFCVMKAGDYTGTERVVVLK